MHVTHNLDQALAFELFFYFSYKKGKGYYKVKLAPKKHTIFYEGTFYD